MISKEEFCSVAGQLITDEDRKQYSKCRKRTTWLLCCILPVIVAIFTLLTIYVTQTSARFVFIPFGTAVFIIATVVICAASGFKWANFKQQYGAKALACLLSDYEYDYKQDYCIPKKIFIASNFAGKFDHYRGEDLLTVKIKNDDGTPSNVEFLICDLDVTETRKRTVVSNGHTRTEEYTVIVYKGAFGYVRFPFSFKCELDINPYRKRNQKISLEDIDFNKRFSVYTSDQVEALCILTPTMMTKLAALDKRVKRLKLSLSDNFLYLGFKRNLFEINKKGHVLDGRVFERFYDDAISIYEILEEIKNNNKVFKM